MPRRLRNAYHPYTRPAPFVPSARNNDFFLHLIDPARNPCPADMPAGFAAGARRFAAQNNGQPHPLLTASLVLPVRKPPTGATAPIKPPVVAPAHCEKYKSSDPPAAAPAAPASAQPPASK